MTSLYPIQNMPTAYATDYQQWVEETVQNLRDRHYDLIDWDNLLEEIADLSRRQRDKLISLVTRLFKHLLKLTYWESEKADNHRKWKGEIRNFRLQIKRLLKSSPSLKTFLASIFEDCYQDARLILIDSTGLDPAIFPTQPRVTLEQLLNEDWLPED
jgi:hypothetical protein